jgi:hypothetical protein
VGCKAVSSWAAIWNNAATAEHRYLNAWAAVSIVNYGIVKEEDNEK